MSGRDRAGTVARAYRELESQGLIRTRRTGSIVTYSPGRAKRLSQAQRRERLTHAALTYRTAARPAGATAGEALELVGDVLTADPAG